MISTDMISIKNGLFQNGQHIRLNCRLEHILNMGYSGRHIYNPSDCDCTNCGCFDCYYASLYKFGRKLFAIGGSRRVH